MRIGRRSDLGSKLASAMASSERASRCSRSDIRVLRAAIDRRLKALFPRGDEETGLEQAIRYAVLTPGKRIRPALTVLAAWELGRDDLAALDPGCALEMVHAASLVLDDLPCMDDAPLRRGEPATHRAFGEDVAVLASVALLSRAFATIGSAPGLSAEQRLRLIDILAEAVGTQGLAGGQFRDLRGGDERRAVAAFSDANHRKTGALFVAAVEMAGVVAQASEARIEELRAFATDLGQAFQIMDDLEDGSGGENGLGEDGAKVTVLSFLGRDGARGHLERHLAQARAALRPEGGLAMFVGAVFAEKTGRANGFQPRI
ncbi:polyprenyl synthetase family protein [Enterovirga aerilata]|uniref:Probable farnesyl diphosphate synthase n=1 Tax=Enterovirga aerilata TaxID=2730920 RepID=A0A849I036_9HYPH|nr:polyprenyl synthetase family protein [Enterovirga sp. DB1703]NNM72702.1 polyprenyl synthetase family protein [Enterovirga sp. DB1703]